MQLLYNMYYRQYGIRRLQQLFMPRLYGEDFFSFPRNAIYHHDSHTLDDLAPDQEQHYFKGYKKRIFMDVVTDLTENKGNARKIATMPQSLYRPFFMKNKLFKYTRNAVSFNKDPQTLTAIDYGYLQKLYRYSKTPLTPYYQWYNIEKTVWNNILKTCRESERQNFVFVKVPDILPSLTMLRLYTNRVNNVFLHVFDSHEKRLILELWRWIGADTRKDSLLGEFAQEDLDKVNLVLTHNGKWCVLNLGVFNRWRKEPKAEEPTEEQVDKSKTPVASVGYQPVQFQKLMLKMFISVQSQSIVDPEAETTETQGQEGPEGQPTEIQKGHETEIEEGDIDHGEVEPEIQPNKVPEVETQERLHELGPEVDLEDSAQLDLDEKAFEELEKDLEALEYIEQKNLTLKGVTKDHLENNKEVVEPEQAEPKVITFEASEQELHDLHEVIYKEPTPQSALKSYIDRHAEYGMMSAAEYRKTIQQSEVFMKMKSGYQPEQSIQDFVQISPADLQISKEEIKIPDMSTVPDKGMLESTLLTFDKKYIKNVLPKDITAMIVNVQKAGIVIQDYQIENESNVLGNYEIHTLRVKPVDGAASTLRFKLPKVDEEGNFIANGNKYHMRKQRGD